MLSLKEIVRVLKTKTLTINLTDSNVLLYMSGVCFTFDLQNICILFQLHEVHVFFNDLSIIFKNKSSVSLRMYTQETALQFIYHKTISLSHACHFFFLIPYSLHSIYLLIPYGDFFHSRDTLGDLISIIALSVFRSHTIGLVFRLPRYRPRYTLYIWQRAENCTSLSPAKVTTYQAREQIIHSSLIYS